MICRRVAVFCGEKPRTATRRQKESLQFALCQQLLRLLRQGPERGNQRTIIRGVQMSKVRIRGVTLLAIVALALPTVALASSFQFKIGDFVSGTITGDFTSPFNLEVVGSLNTFLVQGAQISSPCEPPLCNFSGGTLKVIPHGSTTVAFTDALTNGTIGITSSDSLVISTISASLVPSPEILSGVLSITAVTSTLARNTDLEGFGSVSGTAEGLETGVIPEPGTLGLLGTGLITLAGFAKHKLKLKT